MSSETVALPPPGIIAQWPHIAATSIASRGPGLFTINAILIIVSTLFVVMRIVLKIRLARSFTVDDAFLVIALIFAIGVASGIAVGCQQYGWDSHVWDTPSEQWTASENLAAITRNLFLCSGTAVQLTWLTYFYRFFHKYHVRSLRPLLHIALGLAVLAWLVSMVVNILRCSAPTSDYNLLTNFKCVPPGAAILFSCIAKTCVDFAIVMIPVPALLQLDVIKQHRVGVIILIILGNAIITADAARAVYVYRAATDALWDRAWWRYPGIAASVVGNSIGMISASALALQPLVRSFQDYIYSLINLCRRTSSSPEMANEKSVYNYTRSSRHDSLHPSLYSSPLTKPSGVYLSSRYENDRVISWGDNTTIWTRSLYCITPDSDTGDGYGGDTGIVFSH